MKKLFKNEEYDNGLLDILFGIALLGLMSQQMIPGGYVIAIFMVVILLVGVSLRKIYIVPRVREVSEIYENTHMQWTISGIYIMVPVIAISVYLLKNPALGAFLHLYSYIFLFMLSLGMVALGLMNNLSRFIRFGIAAFILFLLSYLLKLPNPMPVIIAGAIGLAMIGMGCRVLVRFVKEYPEISGQ